MRRYVGIKSLALAVALAAVAAGLAAVLSPAGIRNACGFACCQRGFRHGGCAGGGDDVG